MGRGVALLVTVLSLSGSLALPAAPAGSGPGEGAGSSREWFSPDGLRWTDATRLTWDPAPDTHPQLAVAPDGTAGVAWNRGTAMYWAKVFNSEKPPVVIGRVANGTFPLQCSGFVSPFIGADSKGNFHFCYRDGDYGAYYTKLDLNGNALVPGKGIPSGGVAVHAPSIAVAPGDIVHLTYEDCRHGYGAEALTYARLLADGTVDRDGIRMSLQGQLVSGTTICSDSWGNVHAVYVNASLDTYHAKLDKFGNPLPQAPPSWLYKASGTYEYVGPAAICADPKGGIHIAWNTNSSGVGKLVYMKLDSNGNKLAAGMNGAGIPITVEPTALGYPAIASDGRGRTYVVWSDVRDVDPRIWYVPVFSDREDDPLLPYNAVCLTPGNRTVATQPAADVGPGNWLHVAWREDIGGNSEICYARGEASGVELGMTPEEMYKVMYARPDETKSANIIVRNTGGRNDTAYLDISADFHGKNGGIGKNYTGEGWKVWIDEKYKELNMDAREMRKIPLNVRGPARGASNEYIEVEISATSQMNPMESDNVRFRSYLVVDHRIALKCAERVHATPAGVPTQYSIAVGNIGSVDESIRISASGPWGWLFEVDSDLVKLRPAETWLLSLNVTPPSYALADDVGVVKVRAECIDWPSRSEEVSTHTVVTGELHMTGALDRTEGWAVPGGMADYNLTLGVSGNLNGEMNLVVELGYGSSGWDVWTDAGSISVGCGDRVTTGIHVVPPRDAPAGSSLTVNITCSDMEKRYLVRCQATTFVRRVSGFDLSVGPSEGPLAPGGATLRRVHVMNLGNAPDSYTPALEGPPGWRLALLLEDGLVEAGGAVDIAGGGGGWFDVLVCAPSGSLAGTYRIRGRVSDGAGDGRGFSFEATVIQLFGLGLESGAPAQAGEPGRWASFPLEVANTGNGPDTIRLAAEGLPEGWPGPFFRKADGPIGDLLELPAGGRGRMEAVVALPDRTELSGVQFNVSAESLGGMRARVPLSLAVSKADLRISSVVPSKEDPRAGELVWVNLTVQNCGTGTARGVVLHFLRNGEALIVRELGELGPGEDGREKFVWIPRPGKNTLLFIVDPEDRVCEADETGNRAVMTHELPGPAAPAPEDLWPTAVAGMAVAIEAVVAAAVLLRRRARRPSTLSVGE